MFLLFLTRNELEKLTWNKKKEGLLKKTKEKVL